MRFWYHSSFVQVKKDDLTWGETRVLGEFELLKAVAHEEISSIEKKGSCVVVKRSSVEGNIIYCLLLGP